MTELEIISDYIPNKNLEDLSSLEESEDTEIEETSSSLLNPLDYFDEITSLNKLETRKELKDEALPVPMDYFKRDRMHRLRYIVTKPEEILTTYIARQYNLDREDLAVTSDNYPEVEKYLFSGQPIDITPHSIQSGVIAAGKNFLVLSGCPNKKGYPGRLFIIYGRCPSPSPTPTPLSASAPPTPTSTPPSVYNTNLTDEQLMLQMEEGLLRRKPIKERYPLEYTKTMREISKYDKSLFGQTIESIEGLREIVENFFMLPKDEQNCVVPKYRSSGMIYEI